MSRAWNNDNSRLNFKTRKSSGDENVNNEKKGEKAFLEAHAKFQASVQKHVTEEYESSSEEELESNNILDSVLASYSRFGGKYENLGRTEKFLKESFQSGAAVCLICIASIKRPDPIWNCGECYCFFHISCTLKWARDSIVNLKQSSFEFPVSDTPTCIQWSCPNCRHAYPEEATPSRYYCFCEKSEDPPCHPWLVPHSCGEICGKPLKPLCGHKCLLLCHPGPCPPCPKTVKCLCYCKKQKAEARLCSNKFWSCGSQCGQILKCGKHSCKNVCHEGKCLPCPKTSVQHCKCGVAQMVRPCASPEWQCGKVCGRPLPCGHHTCAQVCHSGECGDCPLSEERSCPCGKAGFTLPCTEDVPLCGDTCGRLLECGIHECSRSCHHDKCGTCLEVIFKTCRCGAHAKEQPCKKEYLCETKCKKSKNCLRHPCNRKCCDGRCPPCEKICGRTLKCGNHKCVSVCHRGPCYPCTQTARVLCFCKATALTVPCGLEKKANPPKCSRPCRVGNGHNSHLLLDISMLGECRSKDESIKGGGIARCNVQLLGQCRKELGQGHICKQPGKCHHTPEMHRCHFGKCPPCRQVCAQVYEACGHLCQARCHSPKYVEAAPAHKPAGPWEKELPAQLVIAGPGCPPCKVEVCIDCLGKHESIKTPCFSSAPYSCARECGRNLTCGNHKCLKLCHKVEGTSSEIEAGNSCDVCESECLKARPEGCTHPCLNPCHPGECPPCKQMLRVRCHCQLNQLYIYCHEWTYASEGNKNTLQNCGNQCPKNFSCGHRCREICHFGPCPNEELCRKKVKVFCECRRFRKEFTCDIVRSKRIQVQCDSVCKKKKDEQIEAQKQRDEQREDEERRRNQEEMERFQKKFQTRKKQKNVLEEDISQGGSFVRQFQMLFCSAAVLVLALYVAMTQLTVIE